MGAESSPLDNELITIADSFCGSCRIVISDSKIEAGYSHGSRVQKARQVRTGDYSEVVIRDRRAIPWCM